MDLGTQLLFFFGCLGVFNGLLMSIYFLFIASPKRLQNQLFGLLLLMLCLRIGKSLLYYFDRSLSKIVLQIGLSACFFIGPLLFLYIRSLLQQKSKLTKSDQWHLGILSGVILLIGIIFPYTTRPELWNPEIVQFIYLVWAIYLCMTLYLLRITFLKAFTHPRSLKPIEQWMLTVVIANVLICLMFNAFLYIGSPSYIFGPLTFSLVFYGLLAFLLFNPESKTIITGIKKKYGSKKIQPKTAKLIADRLDQYMVTSKSYLNSDLKLNDVASDLDLTPHTLSQLLNDNLGKGFADFVNSYRIQAATELLKTNKQYTIEGIANEVGFRSKSAFYNAFKKNIGCTPSQFQKQF